MAGLLGTPVSGYSLALSMMQKEEIFREMTQIERFLIITVGSMVRKVKTFEGMKSKKYIS